MDGHPRSCYGMSRLMPHSLPQTIPAPSSPSKKNWDEPEPEEEELAPAWEETDPLVV